MLSSLAAPQTSETLRRLHALAAREDTDARRKVKEREAKVGRRLSAAQRHELCWQAPLAVCPDRGRLLYVLALNRGATRIVEFGSSLGLSTIYLAAAVKDAGTGQVVSTEQHPAKATLALGNLAKAGLAAQVELRVGDARETLAGLSHTIELLFLDGRSDQYLTLLRYLEPRFAPNALVIANLRRDDPELSGYLSHIRGWNGRYTSMWLPLGEGVEISVWLG